MGQVYSVQEAREDMMRKSERGEYGGRLMPSLMTHARCRAAAAHAALQAGEKEE